MSDLLVIILAQTNHFSPVQVSGPEAGGLLWAAAAAGCSLPLEYNLNIQQSVD